MPDNAFYFKAAYSVTIVLYTGYAITLAWRRRALAARRERQRRAAP